ncbi:hypothetical protein N0V82_003900 [Gnomoniopsis sp. IMI 355080]|nr:hypothetical protein N0V82_003900 [Gnomoniopsis sp. IMI 355080]
MTNLGALTTTFSAPSSCASSTGISIVGCGDGCVWWAEGPVDLTSSYPCYPSFYNPTLSHYYSPGVCPSGYTAACQSITKSSTVTETVQTCCPTALGYDYGCVVPTWPWQSFLGCTVYESTTVANYFDFPTVTSVDDNSTTHTTSTARSELGIGAYGVEVRWQATDFVSTTVTPQSVSSTKSTATTPSATTTPAAATTTSSTSAAAGLSSGAAAGIGVGVAVLFLAAATGAFFLIRRMRQRRKVTTGAVGAAQVGGDVRGSGTELGDSSVHRSELPTKPEMRQGPQYTTSSQMPPSELPAQAHTGYHELPAQDGHWGS